MKWRTSGAPANRAPYLEVHFGLFFGPFFTSNRCFIPVALASSGIASGGVRFRLRQTLGEVFVAAVDICPNI